MSFVHDGTASPTAPPKDPGETRWYGVAWDDVLGASVMDAIDWTVPDELSIVDQVDDEPQLVDVGLPGERTWTRVNKVLLAGGIADGAYTVTNQVTVDGEIIPRSFTLPVCPL